MQNYIEFADEIRFNIPDQPNSPIENRRTGREWKAITVTGIVEDAKAAFIDNAQYAYYWESQKYDDEGNPDGTEMLSEDLSDYCVAGDIVDTRDGNITIYMGKKTEKELLQEAVDELLLDALGGTL